MHWAGVRSFGGEEGLIKRQADEACGFHLPHELLVKHDCGLRVAVPRKVRRQRVRAVTIVRMPYLVEVGEPLHIGVSCALGKEIQIRFSPFHVRAIAYVALVRCTAVIAR